ncbi:MAG: glycosyltransferase family 4 protein [Bacteroidales bacterium]|nr:glycosyltransferase family 4 protein [Bacteroidales bacterium]
MKIVVNTRLLLKNKLEGIGWFSYETIKYITQNHPEHEFIFVFDRPYDEEFIFSDNVKPVVLFPPTRHPVLQYIWFEFGITHLLKKTRPDLFLSTDGYLSLRTKIPSITVIHDLNFEYYPQDVSWANRKFFKRYFSKYAKKAVRVGTVSEYSKNDIVNLYQINPDKIDVIYNGVNKAYTPLSEEEIADVRNSLTGGEPYFIYIGALRPRKNLKTLFRAFDAFRKESDSHIKLVVVGDKKWHGQEMQQTYEAMQHKDEVIFTGSLTSDKLREVLGAALALTYVSYFEGFGIPIVEAFQAGVPVITSDITSMPEVAGDAALLIDPFSRISITKAMLKIASDNDLRKDLIAKGHRREDVFTWEKSGKRLWNCIEKALKSS